jgi:hypothetical protein
MTFGPMVAIIRAAEPDRRHVGVQGSSFRFPVPLGGLLLQAPCVDNLHSGPPKFHDSALSPFLQLPIDRFPPGSDKNAEFFLRDVDLSPEILCELQQASGQSGSERQKRGLF